MNKHIIIMIVDIGIINALDVEVFIVIIVNLQSLQSIGQSQTNKEIIISILKDLMRRLYNSIENIIIKVSQVYVQGVKNINL